MKERPIPFSDPMVLAILDGWKTQTRRVCKAHDVNGKGFDTYGEDGLAALIRHHCPYGVPGDRLWVRETWWHNSSIPGIEGCMYRADGEMPKHMNDDWRPSIHMPRWASRILLEVIEVRVERLQEIDRLDQFGQHVDGGAWAEGFRAPSPTARFVMYWEKLNGKKPGHDWASNPWVWVVEFRVLEAPNG